ncbi:MAG: HDOD domain-containing protein [Gammaproteobacteria bacterium]|nr:HDOD domain-containing protein [Gammaproteobacteria bacterium]
MITSAYDLVKDTESVASLPNIFLRLDKLINDASCDLSDIAEVISEDTGLSARLLKIANSAMFNFPAEIDSITRAVAMVGTRQLRDLVLATQIIAMFDQIDDSVVNMRSFWKHSIATGILARLLASYRREQNIEYFYLLGLLHDIGRLVMFIEQPEMALKAIAYRIEHNVSLNEAELCVFGFDHSAVGAELMCQWGLPRPMYDAVCYHHKPSLSLNNSVDAAVIHVADIMVNALNIGCSGESDIPPMDESAWDRLELSPYVLADAVGYLDQQFNEVVNLFIDDASCQ